MSSSDSLGRERCQAAVFLLGRGRVVTEFLLAFLACRFVVSAANLALRVTVMFFRDPIAPAYVAEFGSRLRTDILSVSDGAAGSAVLDGFSVGLASVVTALVRYVIRDVLSVEGDNRGC